jgi:cyclic 2,3-diphosphoglycerate synthetase
MSPGTRIRKAQGETALALIDGEHYPEVIRDALSFVETSLGYRLVAIVFLGGTEKMTGVAGFSYRDLPVYDGGGQVENLRRAIAECGPSVVLDLSDEPVVGYEERFQLISHALALGASYRGPDFEFSAPERPYLCSKPCIGIWGSGKRVGKTAVSGHFARHLASRGAVPCVLTMGRGGPAEPELLAAPADVTDDYLLCRVEDGCHAASDHFEDAMMASVISVGTRRCGGGMAGVPFYSNVREGAALACGQQCDVILCEGSGAAIPPVGVDSVVLVASAAQPLEHLLGYLGTYRLLLSDLVVVTMCEDFLVSSEKIRKFKDGVQSINPGVKVVTTVLRPRPLGDLEGSMAFLTSTASGRAVEIQAKYLEEKYGATILGASSNLADRSRLERDLEAAAGADVLVTELKAAGVDTVSMFARQRGKRLIYIDNVPVSPEGNLERELNSLDALARKRCRLRESAGAL